MKCRQVKEMPFRGGFKPPKTHKTKPMPSNPHSFQTKSALRNDGWNKYPNNPTSIPTNHTPTRPKIRPPTFNPINPNQPQIHALISQIQETANQDAHIDRNLLQQMQSLHSILHTQSEDVDLRQHPQQ